MVRRGIQVGSKTLSSKNSVMSVLLEHLPTIDPISAWCYQPPWLHFNGGPSRNTGRIKMLHSQFWAVRGGFHPRKCNFEVDITEKWTLPPGSRDRPARLRSHHFRMIYSHLFVGEAKDDLCEVQRGGREAAPGWLSELVRRPWKYWRLMERKRSFLLLEWDGGRRRNRCVLRGRQWERGEEDSVLTWIPGDLKR